MSIVRNKPNKPVLKRIRKYILSNKLFTPQCFILPDPMVLLNIISNVYLRYYKCQSCSFQKASTTLLYEILKSSCLMSTFSSQLKSFVRFFIVAICRIRFSLHILHYFSYQLRFSLQKKLHQCPNISINMIHNYLLK